MLSASFQGLRRLFVLAYFIPAGAANDEAGIKDNKKYFLRRGEIKNDNGLIAERNYEVRKVSAGYGDDYTTGCFLDYAYFKDNCRPTAVDLSEQKALDADPRAIQQIVFQGNAEEDDNTKIRLYLTLEKSRETVLEFYKGTAKVL